MADNDDAFGQRKSGRRAQRRKERKEAFERGIVSADDLMVLAAASPCRSQQKDVAALSPQKQTTMDDGATAAATAAAVAASAAAASAAAAAAPVSDLSAADQRGETKKGPSDEIQSRIDAAISLRAGHGHGHVAAATEQYYPQPQTLSRQMMEPDKLEGCQYEYLDHTADVQLHSWGNDIVDALGQLAVAMFGYMTSLQSIEVDEHTSTEVASNIVARGHDMNSLVYSFLDEWLFLFHDTGFIAREVEVFGFDRESFVIQSRGWGEIFRVDKHPQGTEVKAITYSNMQIQEEDADGNGMRGDKGKRCDIWVIVDI